LGDDHLYRGSFEAWEIAVGGIGSQEALNPRSLASRIEVCAQTSIMTPAQGIAKLFGRYG